MYENIPIHICGVINEFHIKILKSYFSDKVSWSVYT